jgi:ABC-2 type transport system ATP-binding protein
MDALKIRQLEKRYDNGVHALKGIDLTVKQGEFFALLGANGAGKSTTIGVLTSLVNKTAGSVSVFGYDLEKQPGLAKAQIGIVPQEFNFSIFARVMDIVVTQAGFYGIPASIARKRAKIVLQQLHLWDKRNSIGKHLSGGMKRRLMIARALMHQPRLLILDEPTAGVDVEIRRATWDFLKKINAQGTTILLTTHYFEEAEHLCKHVAIINHGKIIADSSMHDMVNTLCKESFIFSTTAPLPNNFSLPHYQHHQIDAHSLEITITKKQTLNNVFQQLSQQQVEISSVRNKTNRLEESFLHFTHRAST